MKQKDLLQRMPNNEQIVNYDNISYSLNTSTLTIQFMVDNNRMQSCLYIVPMKTLDLILNNKGVFSEIDQNNC